VETKRRFADWQSAIRQTVSYQLKESLSRSHAVMVSRGNRGPPLLREDPMTRKARWISRSTARFVCDLRRRRSPTSTPPAVAESFLPPSRTGRASFPPNQVLYRDAFQGARADVLDTYRRRGLEADIILWEIPPPSDVGLNPDTTRMGSTGSSPPSGRIRVHTARRRSGHRYRHSSLGRAENPPRTPERAGSREDVVNDQDLPNRRKRSRADGSSVSLAKGLEGGFAWMTPRALNRGP